MIWQLNPTLHQWNPFGVPGLDTVELVGTSMMAPISKSKIFLTRGQLAARTGFPPYPSIFSSSLNADGAPREARAEECSQQCSVEGWGAASAFSLARVAGEVSRAALAEHAASSGDSNLAHSRGWRKHIHFYGPAQAWYFRSNNVESWTHKMKGFSSF